MAVSVDMLRRSRSLNEIACNFLGAPLIAVAVTLSISAAGFAQELDPKLVELQAAREKAVSEAFVQFYVHGQADMEKSEAYKYAREADKAFKNNDFAVARDLYNKAIVAIAKPSEKVLMTTPDAIKYRLANLYCARGACALGLKDSTAAVNDFGTAMNSCPDFQVPYVYRSKLYSQMNVRNASTRDMKGSHRSDYPPFLQRVLNKDPVFKKTSDAFAQALSKHLDSEVEKKFYVDGKKGKEASKVEKLHARAVLLMHQQRFNEAIVPLTGAIKAFGTPAEKALYRSEKAANYKNSLNYESRGYCYLMMRDYQEAVSDLTAAIKLRPGYRENYVNRGKALMILGRKAEGQADLDKAKVMRPNKGPDI